MTYIREASGDVGLMGPTEHNSIIRDHSEFDLSRLRQREVTLLFAARPCRKGIVSTREQLSQLVYCEAVVKESLRLTPAAATLWLHSMVCGGEL